MLNSSRYFAFRDFCSVEAVGLVNFFISFLSFFFWFQNFSISTETEKLLSVFLKSLTKLFTVLEIVYVSTCCNH